MTARPAIVASGRGLLLARLIINGVLQAGVMVVTALLVKQVFDGFVAPLEPHAAAGLWWYGVGLLVAAIAIAALRMVERIDAERLGQAYTHELRLVLFDHMSRLTPRVLRQRSRGGVLLRFMGDLTALKQWVSQGVARLSVAGVTLLGTLAALVLVSAPLALIVALSLAAGGWAVTALGRYLERCAREVRRRRSHLATNVAEKVSALGAVQVCGQVDRERRRVRRQSRRLVAAMVTRARAVGAMRGVVELTAGCATAGALLVGAVMVGRGQGTAGTVVGAMTIVGLLTPSLRDLGRVREYWHGAVVSWEKIDDFLALPASVSDRPGAVALATNKVELAFDRVSVTGALEGITALARSGETVAVVGPNGAGKSTLLAVVARLSIPDSGRVRLAGQDITGVTLASLSRTVGLVSTDLPLLRGTVDSNLRYRWPDAPDEEVARVRAHCGIDEMLAELPRGGKTRIGEGGVNLSLGQRQRLALARGLLGQPPLLLVDELDANLDPGVAMAMRRLLAGYSGTVVMVTHRMDWAAMADTIWFLRDGRLVEAGPAAQLLEGEGPTAELFHRPRAVAVG